MKIFKVGKESAVLSKVIGHIIIPVTKKIEDCLTLVRDLAAFVIGDGA